MSTPVLVAFASGSEDLIPTLLDSLQALAPELELVVVSEFAPPRGHWIPYAIGRSLRDNLDRVRWELRGRRIHLAGVILQPNMPFWRMRLIPVLLAPHRTVFFNENLDHFMLRPRSLGVMSRHFAWRARNFVRWQLQPGGAVYTFLWRLLHPSAFKRPIVAAWAGFVGWFGFWTKRFLADKPVAEPVNDAVPGITVVVPSRNGRDLLERLLPGLLRELEAIPSEVIVSDNGSSDGTAAFLADAYPTVSVLESEEPLSFARAVNRGVAAARFSHVCLLNNDMELLPGFFAPLLNAFTSVPGLFCATAQIFFPEGVRRQETGKAVMPLLAAQRTGTGFPVTCLTPIAGEDLTYVLYGSGGCSLYDAAKLRSLGAVGEIYEPAYVEDLDLGYRAWRRGWPSVFVAAAQLIHRHRTTTSRYYSEHELGFALEMNYLRFLMRAVGDPLVFRTLWRDAMLRLNLMAVEGSRYATKALRQSMQASAAIEPPPAGGIPDAEVIAIGSGELAVFPGAAPRGLPVVVVASPYIPFPLSHGGAVRMFNLMREAAREFDLVLLTFVDTLATPPPELLELVSEIVEVRTVGRHDRPLTDRPDVVEEFDSPVFRAALKQTIRKWNAKIVQLEFTQLGQYHPDCAPAKTILVEHDITLDLYEQLLAQKGGDWETERQLERWRRFEHAVWKEVDCVVTMSGKDKAKVKYARRVEAIANGVDLDRFQVSAEEPEPARLLFLGSFAHLPNVLAIDFFLRVVWPQLNPRPTLHVIAGRNHRFFLERCKDSVAPPLDQEHIEVEDFVSDVRPAYRRATLVIAPLLASAGTNIKIMEAMAMGKAVVSTPGGVNGLDELARGRDVVVTPAGPEMAAAIQRLIEHPEERRTLERQARATAERVYGWGAIGRTQARLYRSLLTQQLP